MVSLPTFRTIPRFITSVVTRRTVHRAFPSGGGPQTNATTAASSTLSSLRAPPGRGSSRSAACSPSARNRVSTRPTSRWYPPTAAAAARTDRPESRCSSVRIRRQVLADSFSPPAFIRFSSRWSRADNFNLGTRFALPVTSTLRSDCDPGRKTARITTARSKH